jgi:hypothetical protein
VVRGQVVKNLSFQENTLEKLDQVNAIRVLVPLMDRRGHVMDKEMENQSLHCIYNLCRVNKKQREKVSQPQIRTTAATRGRVAEGLLVLQAAVAGVVPLLQRCYHERSHMKEIALTIVCDLAHASDATREELWKNQGVEFYLLLLQESYWQVRTRPPPRPMDLTKTGHQHVIAL